MIIRPFDWRDLPALHRYRNQCVYLHSSLVLTRGPNLIPNAVLSPFTQAMGIYTSVCVDNGEGREVFIGQATHSSGSQFGQLVFLAPCEALRSPSLPPLLEHLTAQMGERGVHRLLADVDEHSEAFEGLRRVGFAIYARQRIWKIKTHVSAAARQGGWQEARDQDAIAIKSFYNNVVPGLVQQVEPLPSQKLRGLLYREGDELQAYAEFKYGHRGIWAQLVVHPDAVDLPMQLSALLQKMPNRFSRPVYFCVRSYVSWLEPILEELGAEAGSRQVVMVKHLVVMQKALRPVSLPALDKGYPEISAPIARSENHS